jgi:acyl-CoA thioesterase 8
MLSIPQTWRYFSLAKELYANHKDSSPFPHQRKPQAWVSCRGSISSSGGQHAHLSALAYMSDSWFIGTVSRAHGLQRFGHQLYNQTFPDLPEPSSIVGQSKNTLETPRRPVGMMVSLDHTIYFHRPKEVKADEWLYSEMETPWSGEGRGLVMQRIWNKDGRLLASCVQEVTYLFIPLQSLGFRI